MKKLIILLLIVLCALPLLFSCKKHEGDNMFVSDRFVIVSEESDDCSISQIIFCDTETGVLYLYVSNGSPAMTVLLDSDGKPLINKPTKGQLK